MLKMRLIIFQELNRCFKSELQLNIFWAVFNLSQARKMYIHSFPKNLSLVSYNSSGTDTLIFKI